MINFESLNECLTACVRAAGGSKVVGHRLWPDKTVDAAQRHLLNCLEEGRAERLSPDKVMLVAELARAAGCHAFMEHCSQRLHYAAPQPVQPADEADDLRRQMLEMGKTLQSALSRLEAIERPPLRGVA